MPFANEENEWWIAGYQDRNGEYHNLQEESGAVSYTSESVSIDWERAEAADSYLTEWHGHNVESAHHVVIGWIDDDGIYHYNTLDGGIIWDDTDYLDYMVDHWEMEY